MPRPPPVLWLAAAYGFGVALPLASLTPPLPLLFILAVLVLIHAWPRPRRHLALVMAFTGGCVAGGSAVEAAGADCRLRMVDGATFRIRGWFESRPGRGPAAFHVSEGLPCRVRVRAVVREPGDLETARIVSAHGRWRVSKRRGLDPTRAGVMTLSEIEPIDEARHRAPFATRVRAAIERRVQGLFPSEWPLVDAMLLAGKSGLDYEVRDRFASAGVAHLLAISGFHVGVVGVLLTVAARSAGFVRDTARLISLAGVWTYVGFLGWPSAAFRAALLLSGMTLAARRARPVSSLGVLASSFIVLLALRPARLADVGFQLSFAGALGLVLVSTPLGSVLTDRARLPAPLASAVSAGVGATLFTMPFVAWHFGRVSILSVPSTLVVSPLFALAIPWTLLALALDVFWTLPATFVAGAAELALLLTRRIVDVLGSPSWAAPSVALPVLAGCAAGVLAASRLVPKGPSVRTRVRILMLGSGVLAGLLATPSAVNLLARRTLSVYVLDVGQGDAILLRTPAGEWFLVDAGPANRRSDAAVDVVLPFLARRGVEKLAGVFFTHADLDHIGGGRTVLSELSVGTVVDPGLPAGKSSYVELLEAAKRARVPWVRARPGMAWRSGGVAIRVLAPDLASARETDPPGGRSALADTETNDASLVMMVEFGEFELLLTGDASAAVERRLAATARLRDVDVLKVGHHGSNTSTSWDFLLATRPELALISAGRGNRFGHPTPPVLARLGRWGARVERTDLRGTIGVRAHRSGRWELVERHLR